MELFSYRMGIKQMKGVQYEQVDPATRNGLWTIFHFTVLAKYEMADSYSINDKSSLYPFLLKLFLYYFKESIDYSYLEDDHEEILEYMRKYFFNCGWNELFDFLEFIYLNIDRTFRDDFLNSCNTVLKKENSGYRFVGGLITPIISQTEIDSIEENRPIIWC